VSRMFVPPTMLACTESFSTAFEETIRYISGRISGGSDDISRLDLNTCKDVLECKFNVAGVKS
jgi:hypothetical protein